jgi:hypothetical protein
MRILEYSRLALTLATVAALSANASALGGDAGEPVGPNGHNDYCSGSGTASLTDVPVVTPGLYCDLSVETDQTLNTYIDEDNFQINVANGDTIHAMIFFSDALADTDLFLYDTAIHSPCSALTTNLGQGFSVSDHEEVTWTNTTGATVNVLIRVNVYTGDSGTALGLSNYDMLIEMSGAGQGTSYCGTRSSNSVGTGAILSSIPAGAGTTDFIVCGLPNQPGVLYYGNAQSNLAFGCGTRCVSGNVVRLGITFGTVITTNATVPAGSNVQYWYRDPANLAACGDVYNLSNAITLP